MHKLVMELDYQGSFNPSTQTWIEKMFAEGWRPQDAAIELNDKMG